jgi:DNA-binding beta-propeller fold protein YncE
LSPLEKLTAAPFAHFALNTAGGSGDGALLGTFKTGPGPQGVTFDGTHIWVMNLGSNTVSKLYANGIELTERQGTVGNAPCLKACR